MTITFPFIFYGIVTDGGTPVSSATVSFQDTTVDQGVASASTNASGKYQINIQNYATDGDTVNVWCRHSGKYKLVTCVVNISGAAQRADLAIVTVEVAAGISFDVEQKSMSNDVKVKEMVCTVEMKEQVKDEKVRL